MTTPMMLLAGLLALAADPLSAAGKQGLDDAVIISTLCAPAEDTAGCEIVKNEPFPDDAAGNKRIFVMTRDIRTPAQDTEYGDCPSGVCAVLAYKGGKLLSARKIASYPDSSAGCSYGANGEGESCYAEGTKIVHLVDGGSSWHWQEMTAWETDPVRRLVYTVERSFHHDMFSTKTKQANGIVKTEWYKPFCEEEAPAAEPEKTAAEEKKAGKDTGSQEKLDPGMAKMLEAVADAINRLPAAKEVPDRQYSDARQFYAKYKMTPEYAYTTIPVVSTDSFSLDKWDTLPFPAKALTIGGDDAGDGYLVSGSTAPYEKAGFKITRLGPKDFLLEITSDKDPDPELGGGSLTILAAEDAGGQGECVQPFEPYSWMVFLNSNVAYPRREDVPFIPTVKVHQLSRNPFVTRVLVSFPKEMERFSFEYSDTDKEKKEISTLSTSNSFYLDGNSLGY
jgi:hypothetical protein